MEGRKVLGLAGAASAAALFITGCAITGSGASAGTEAKAACKGQGFVSLIPEEFMKASQRS
jgi:hypothetical protein